jgi:hypothetical protein
MVGRTMAADEDSASADEGLNGFLDEAQQQHL